MNSAAATVIIADDEPLARERLRMLIRSSPEFQLVGEAANGPDAVRLIRECRPGIAILDIRLPGLDAFQVLHQLQDRTAPAVIFVTAFGGYALDAFHAGAVDYLLKPFDPRRLRDALNRARSLGTAPAPEALEPMPLPVAPINRIALRVSGRIIIVELDDLELIMAANSRCEVFTLGDSSVMIQESLGHLVTRLPPERFLRASRFAVVNASFVVSVTAKSHGDQILQLRSGRQVTVARTCREEFLRRLHLPR